jgi:hypothetical protein
MSARVSSGSDSKQDYGTPWPFIEAVEDVVRVRRGRRSRRVALEVNERGSIDMVTKKISKKTKKSGASKIAPAAAFPFAVGDKLFIRTVTMYHLGKLKDVGSDFLVLEDGGWVADTKRLSETLETGLVNEFERAPSWFVVGRGAIVDMFPWPKDIPAKTI